MNKNGVIAVVVVMAAVLLIGLWVMGSGGQRRGNAQVDCGGPPDAPTNVAHTKAGDKVVVTWAAPTGAEKPTTYVVEAGNGPGLNNAGTYVTPGSVTNLERQAPPGTYYVRVFSRNACGTSQAAPEMTVTVP